MLPHALHQGVGQVHVVPATGQLDAQGLGERAAVTHHDGDRAVDPLRVHQRVAASSTVVQMGATAGLLSSRVS